jgi:peptide deformylase
MKLKLSYWDNPILRKKCRPIEEITDEIKQLVSDMIETMDANRGVGLAAPQVGKDLRLFVLRNTKEDREGKLILTDPEVYINPILSQPSEQTEIMQEGCLSFLHLDISRPYSITVQAMDLQGLTFTKKLQGFNARVVMHENDHINGKLFIDRIPLKERTQIEPILKELKKKYCASN